MKRSKRLIFLVGSLLVLGVAVPGAALAETWNWVMETHGENISWTSPTAVPITWKPYHWSAGFTKIEAQLVFTVWLDVTAEFGDTTAAGISQALPFDIINEPVNEPGTLVCDIHHWVDGAGNGQFTIANVVFGTLLGSQITGFRATGSTTVVPEPAGIILLLSGAIAIGLVALRRRSR